MSCGYVTTIPQSIPVLDLFLHHRLILRQRDILDLIELFQTEEQQQILFAICVVLGATHGPWEAPEVMAFHGFLEKFCSYWGEPAKIGDSPAIIQRLTSNNPTSKAGLRENRNCNDVGVYHRLFWWFSCILFMGCSGSKWFWRCGSFIIFIFGWPN